MRIRILTLLFSLMVLLPAVVMAQSNVPPREVTHFAPELAPHGSQQSPAAPGTTESLQTPNLPQVPSTAAQDEAAKRREAAKILKEQKKLLREQKKQEREAALERKKAEREAKRAERKKKAEERDAKRKEKMKQNLPKFGRPETGSSGSNQSTMP